MSTNNLDTLINNLVKRYLWSLHTRNMFDTDPMNWRWQVRTEHFSGDKVQLAGAQPLERPRHVCTEVHGVMRLPNQAV